MAATGNLYASTLTQALTGNIVYAAGTQTRIKLALVSGSYTPNLATHVHWSDVSANEVTGTGYTAGGIALATTTVTTTAAASATAAAISTAYTVGQIVRPATSNGFVYLCVVAGTSGGTAPTWPTVYGQNVTDGSVTWVMLGESFTAFSSAAVTWTTSTITATYGVIYDSNTGTNTTEPLLALINLNGGTAVSSSAGNFVVTPSTLGWFATLPA